MRPKLRELNCEFTWAPGKPLVTTGVLPTSMNTFCLAEGCANATLPKHCLQLTVGEDSR